MILKTKSKFTKTWENILRHDQEVIALHVPFGSLWLKNKNIHRNLSSLMKISPEGHKTRS